MNIFVFTLRRVLFIFSFLFVGYASIEKNFCRDESSLITSRNSRKEIEAESFVSALLFGIYRKRQVGRRSSEKNSKSRSHPERDLFKEINGNTLRFSLLAVKSVNV